MTSRTINLKMVLNRSELGKEVTRALWATHHYTNQAVSEIEKLLILCRGKSYWAWDGNDEEYQVPGEEVRAKAIIAARKAIERNGGNNKEISDGEIISSLRFLYEVIIPACNEGGKGTAQAANAFVSPLMDAESQAFFSTKVKVLDPLPNWVAMREMEGPGWETASEEWLKSEEFKKITAGSGNKPGWIKKIENNLPWHEGFLDDQKKNKKKLEEGDAKAVLDLKEKAIFPMLVPYINSKMTTPQKGVSTIDRLAMRLAAAHLLSWESWNHNTKKEYLELQGKLEIAQTKTKPFPIEIKRLKKYEKDRHQELMAISEANDDNPFKINARSIRAWKEIKEAWKKAPSEEKRFTILKEMQTRMRGKFGDPHLFYWLARKDNEGIWTRDNILPLHVSENSLERRLSRKRLFAMHTPADSRLHPRWASYEAMGGTNLWKYELSENDGACSLKLKLLTPATDGKLEEKEFTIPLAPSGQFQKPDIQVIKIKNKKNQKLAWTSAHQRFSGKPGGSDILFDREYLERRSPEELAEGDIGPVWFKLTVDVDSKAPPQWLDKKGRVKNPPEVTHFKTSLAKTSKTEAELEPGLRVLSVDLGLRAFASCSVFELTDEKPSKGLFFKAASKKPLWAHHKRSFVLHLPGEKANSNSRLKRREALAEIRSLRRDMNRLRNILRLGVLEEPLKREKVLQELIENIQQEETYSKKQNLPGSSLSTESLNALDIHWETSAQDEWRKRVHEVFLQQEKQLGSAFQAWRKATSSKPENWQEWKETRAYKGGKSIWMVEYLENVRRLLIGWSQHGREYGQINRMDKKEFGSRASRLLRHINNLKEDRVKSGADLLVQAARGYIPIKDGAGWEKRFAPCRVILFEDLARYRFQTDRPKRENSRLMLWSHREIFREVEMQAEIYGIVLTEVEAGFSSKLHAPTGAPGIRGRRLTEFDFTDGKLPEYLLKELGLNENKSQLKPKDLIPKTGGNTFISLKSKSTSNGREKDTFLLNDADINAAQNLQKRFWGRSGTAFRMSARKVDGKLYPARLGLRLLGALASLKEIGGKGYCCLISDKNGGYKPEPITRRSWEKAVGIKNKSAEEKDIFDDGDMEMAQISTESSGEIETLFRDPSGTFFPADRWIPAKTYWSKVHREIKARLRLPDTHRKSGSK